MTHLTQLTTIGHVTGSLAGAWMHGPTHGRAVGEPLLEDMSAISRRPVSAAAGACQRTTRSLRLPV
jgi:hypothetical protein